MSTLKFIVKRLLQSVLILFFVMLIIYVLMRCLPTSFIEDLARKKANQPNSKSYEEWMEQLAQSYGYSPENTFGNIFSGFFQWIGNAFKGNFGDSWYYTKPVTDVFAESIGISFVMGAVSLVFEVIISVPLGIIAARKQYSAADYSISVIAIACMSLPTFFLIALLKLVFCINLGWFDLIGQVGRDYEQLSGWGQFLDRAHHLILPIMTLVLISIGSWMRYVRTNMLEVLNADYIRTARAKGLSDHKVIYKHAFRNTLIPLVTFIGGSLPALFSGALFTETMFSIKGIGYMSYYSMVAGDIPFTMFYLAFLAILTLLGNLIADILYAVVDPRVRIS